MQVPFVFHFLDGRTCSSESVSGVHRLSSRLLLNWTSIWCVTSCYLPFVLRVLLGTAVPHGNSRWLLLGGWPAGSRPPGSADAQSVQ